MSSAWTRARVWWNSEDACAGIIYRALVNRWPAILRSRRRTSLARRNSLSVTEFDWESDRKSCERLLRWLKSYKLLLSLIELYLITLIKEIWIINARIMLDSRSETIIKFNQGFGINCRWDIKRDCKYVLKV